MSGLLQRGITAFFFVVVVVGCILGGAHTFVILFAIITLLCLWEFFNIVLIKNKKRDLLRRILGLCLGFVPYLLAVAYHFQIYNNSTVFIALASLLFFPIVFTSFIYELYTKSEQPFHNVAFIVLGLFYIGFPFALLCFAAFHNGIYEPTIILGILIMNWLNDTGAYMFGSKFGKTPLFPRISPKKTWEGGAGGLLGAVIAAWGMSYFTDTFTLSQWLGLAAIVVVFGDLGDLVESMLKRSFGIKDSGNLLPGHGGFLDRFDAFIFLLPFATAYILLLC
ncbi:MAG: phosphatidate cytidylyltransferase [Chitinophagales bacterium]|nr:phosphatidate cytidylyltransferase [Chitinophagales bacterium]